MTDSSCMLVAFVISGMANSREPVFLLHPTPHAVKFADVVRVRLDCGIDLLESLKTPVPVISKRKLALHDIVSPCSTSAFDETDAEDDELRMYMETIPCDRDLFDQSSSGQPGFETSSFLRM